MSNWISHIPWKARLGITLFSSLLALILAFLIGSNLIPLYIVGFSSLVIYLGWRQEKKLRRLNK